MLHGQRLCIYLDPSREWPPSLEMGGGRAEDVAQGAERLWREGHSASEHLGPVQVRHRAAHQARTRPHEVQESHPSARARVLPGEAERWARIGYSAQDACGLAQGPKVTPVIDKTYPLSEVSEAIGYVGDGHARGKVVISV